MLYTVQIIKKENDSRSKPFTASPEILVKALKGNSDVAHDDYVLVLMEIDPDDKDQFVISTKPIVRVSRFVQLLSRSLKDAA